jgi:hypothetical protein
MEDGGDFDPGVFVELHEAVMKSFALGLRIVGLAERI